MIVLTVTTKGQVTLKKEVLRQGRRLAPDQVAAEIRALMQASTVVADRLAVEAGLAIADAGGDFADGVIAHEGRGMGSELFISFDKKAVQRLNVAGFTAKVPDTN